MTRLTNFAFYDCQVHVGTQNCNSQMESYIYDRTRDGVFYLDLAKTWEKTMVAARIIAAIQAKNPKDVLVSATAEDLLGWTSDAPSNDDVANLGFSRVY